MNGKKILQSALIVLAVVLAVVFVAVVPAYFIAGRFLMADNFTDAIVKMQRSGQVYFVVPENKLEGAILVNSQGTRHYVLSEERLRLLGPKLLTGDK